ncbi:MAG: hypothetical protein ACNA77_10885, partial [Opitutales bacterium]
YQNLFCEATKLAVSLERSFLHKLGGGCQTPVGAHYDGKRFAIYHPKTGCRSFDLELTDYEAILPALDKVLKSLNL